MKGQVIDSRVSAMGEVKFHGRVRKVVGIHEKLPGAARLGICKVSYPLENDAQVQELPQSVKERLELVAVSDVRQACKAVSG